MNKTDATMDAIRKMADDAEPGGKLPTIRHLCENLDVSRVTLDRALSRLQEQGLIVRKHGQGIYSTGRTPMTVIAILFGLDPFVASASSYYQLLVDRFRTCCREGRLGLRTYIDPPWAREGKEHSVQRRLEADIRAGRVHGVILPASRGQEQSSWLRAQRVPHIVVGDAHNCGRGVLINRALMIGLGVEALKQSGCQRIGLIHHRTHRWGMDLDKNKLVQFRLALERAGLRFDERWCFRPTQPAQENRQAFGAGWEELTYHGMAELIGQWSSHERPDGLLCLDDMMTRGTLAALHRHHVRLGRDVHIATHANKGSSALLGYEQDLIRLEIDPVDMAEILFEQMVDLMKGRRPRRSLIVVDPVLIMPGQTEANALDSQASQLDEASFGGVEW